MICISVKRGPHRVHEPAINSGLRHSFTKKKNEKKPSVPTGAAAATTI